MRRNCSYSYFANIFDYVNFRHNVTRFRNVQESQFFPIFAKVCSICDDNPTVRERENILYVGPVELDYRGLSWTQTVQWFVIASSDTTPTPPPTHTIPPPPILTHPSYTHPRWLNPHPAPFCFSRRIL